jgi:hypothetical protein
MSVILDLIAPDCPPLELAFPPPPALGFSDTDGVRRMQ